MNIRLIERWRCWAAALAIHALVLQGLFAAAIGAAQAAEPDLPFVLCTHDGSNPISPLDTGHHVDCCGVCCLAHVAALAPPAALEPSFGAEAKLVRRGDVGEAVALIATVAAYQSRAPPA